MYTNIAANKTAITEENASYCMSLTGEYDIKSQKDKLWLLSVDEITKFLPTDADRVWSNTSDFWLRSPTSASVNSNSNVIGGTGFIDNGDACFYFNYVRAAFKI